MRRLTGLAPALAFAVLTGATLLTGTPARAAPAAGPAGKAAAKKDIQWMTNFTSAFTFAQKSDKLMFVYFSGSDWDEFGQKLDKEVLGTQMIRDWVEKSVIPVRIDFPKEKPLTGALKGQNDRLKVTYNVSRVPTFLFIEPSGEVLARCGYDTAKLRDNEDKEQPKAWIEFCESVLKARPPKETLLAQETLKDAVKFSRAHAMPLLILSTQNPSETAKREKDALLANQQFVRFVNRNLVFVELDWPAEFDKSPDAEYARSFAAQWKFGPSPLQLILWDPGGLGKLKSQTTAVSGNPQTVGPLCKQLEAQLPNIDYNGGWIEDYKVAKAVAYQQKKDLLIAFVSSNNSVYTEKMDQEIFSTPEFKKYAKDNLVLLKVDFPKETAAASPEGAPAAPATPGRPAYSGKTNLTTPTSRPATTQKSAVEYKEDMVTGKNGSQPPALKEQNRTLAEMYNIRGYPTVIVLNNLGQKIIEAKYQKGGPKLFLDEIEKVRKKEKDRRTLISEQEAAK